MALSTGGTDISVCAPFFNGLLSGLPPLALRVLMIPALKQSFALLGFSA
jgi:hypothetical protein